MNMDDDSATHQAGRDDLGAYSNNDRTGSERWYLPILILTVSLLYTATLSHNFVWDDHVYVTGNRAYQSFDLRSIFFSLANRVEYLPVRDLSLALDYLLWGESPFGFHLSNVVLFCLNIALIYLFACELPFAGESPRLRRHVAFLTALIFGVHPLISEPVNLIAFRNVLLSGAFFFLAALLYARDLNSAAPFSLRTPLALALCFLAVLLSKATAVILPGALLLLAFTIPSQRTTRQKAVTLSPLFVMATLFFVFYRTVATGTGIINDQVPVSFAETLTVAVQIPFFYLRKTLFPVGLSAEYAADGFSQLPASPAVTMSVIGLLALSTVAVLLRRREPLPLFSLLWFGITLVPVLNFFGTNPIVADRYAYLPAFAIMYPVAVLLTRWGVSRPAWSSTMTVVIVAILGVATFSRSLEWRSDVSLWQANIRTQPSNAKAYQNLIAEALIRGDYASAQQILQDGREHAPSPAYSYLEGKMDYLRHDQSAALEAFQEAVRQDSENIRSLLNIGIIYQEQGNYRKAEEYFRRTLTANAPDGWGCRDEARRRLDEISRMGSVEK